MFARRLSVDFGNEPLCSVPVRYGERGRARLLAGELAQPSRARKQAGSPCDGSESAKSVGEMRKQDAGRSLTVAARMQSPATPGLPAHPTGPRAYFITFACYGAWVHGDAGGSVDRRHNVFGTPVIEPNSLRESVERDRLRESPYELDTERRDQVLEAIREVCAHRGWWLFAAHVRSTHVHVIVQAGDPPEKVMNDFKVYTSRRLNETGLDQLERRRWARHGSTRYLWKQEDLEGAIRYVLHEQGAPMATYTAPGLTRQRPQPSRAREQAGSPGDGSEPVKPTGDMRTQDPGRSLTVAAQMGTRQTCDSEAQPSRARKQAGAPSVGSGPLKSESDVRKQDTGHSLTRLRLATARQAVVAQMGARGRAGFTLVEILVVLVLLSLIVFALMAVFSGAQKAFRASVTQTDALESGRAVMDLIASDMAEMAHADWTSNLTDPSVNNYAPVNCYISEKSAGLLLPSPYPLVQPLISSPSGAARTNLLEDIFILSKANISGVPSWVGTGYSVNTNLPDGTLFPLYRFYMTTNFSSGPSGATFLFDTFAGFQYTNSAQWSHLMDGVVNLTARTYDTNGVWMTNGYLFPQVMHVRFARFNPDLNGVTDAVFYSNAVPASVDVVLGTLEDHTLQHAEGLSGAAQSNYLAGAAAQVHLFERRVPIRNFDPTAYQ